MPNTKCKIFLTLTGLAFIYIGCNAFYDPIQALAGLDLGVDTVNARNELLANYGGLHIGIGLFFIIGAPRNNFRTPALVFLTLLTLGLSAGRIVSIVVDGWPSALNNFLLGLELFTAMLAALFLYFESCNKKGYA